jgi:hypothetical protein
MLLVITLASYEHFRLADMRWRDRMRIQQEQSVGRVECCGTHLPWIPFRGVSIFLMMNRMDGQAFQLRIPFIYLAKDS